MAKTEIAKASDTAVFRPQDIFSTMRHEMDRMFERFEHGFPRCPHLFHAESGTIIVPELDVRDNLHVHHHRGRAAGRRGEGCLARAPLLREVTASFVSSMILARATSRGSMA